MLIGKMALITGGARGIGAGIARAMASQGARVALLVLAALMPRSGRVRCRKRNGHRAVGAGRSPPAAR